MFGLMKHNTMCPKSPATQFKASTLSCSYMKTIHHEIILLTYVIDILLCSIHVKYNFVILTFYPFLILGSHIGELILLFLDWRYRPYRYNIFIP